MNKRIPLFLVLLPHLMVILIFFLKSPPVWPDEAIFMDTVLTFLITGKMATNIFGGAIPGLEQRALWYPPLYFYILAGWVKIFGSSIEMMRLLSIIFSFGSLIFLYELVIELFHKTKFALIAVVLLSLDFWFVQTSGVGRMDSFSFFLLIVTFFLFVKSVHQKNTSYLISAGVTGGIGIITHPLGLIMPFAIGIYTLLTQDSIKNKLLSLFRFGIPIVILLSSWLLLISRHLNLFILQYRLQFERKALAPSYVYKLFLNDNVWKVIFFLYFIIAACLFIQILKKRDSIDMLIFIGILVSVPVLLWGKEMWYMVYFQPFVTLALISLLASSETSKKELFFITRGILFILVLLYCKILNDSMNQISYENSNYHFFTAQIKEKLPNEGTVFLSVIPDPYFDLKIQTRLTFYEFPTVPVTHLAYRKLLDSSDYIVINNFFGSSYIEEYIKKNMKEYVSVNDSNYKVTIIKLKPRNKRI